MTAPTDRERHEHVASAQPLAHLFTVPLDVVRRRVTNPNAQPVERKTARPARPPVRSIPSGLIPAHLKETQK